MLLENNFSCSGSSLHEPPLSILSSSTNPPLIQSNPLPSPHTTDWVIRPASSWNSGLTSDYSLFLFLLLFLTLMASLIPVPRHQGPHLLLLVVVSLLVFLPPPITSCPAVVGNCYVLPPDDEWNRAIDEDPVDYMSSCYVAAQLNGYNVHLDFGDTEPYYGISYSLVPGTQPKLPVEFYGNARSPVAPETIPLN